VECCSSAPRWSASSGYATLKGGGKVEVKSDPARRPWKRKNIIIATGSEARMLPGLAARPGFILTNIEILNLTAVPKSLAIIGAGAVGVEFASFSTASAPTSRSSKCCRASCRWRTKTSPRSWSATSASRHSRGNRRQSGEYPQDRSCRRASSPLTTKDGKQEELEAEKLLVAVGRKPNTENIGLENTRVELDRGFIKVDPYQQTAEPGVYAIGDVVAGTPQLAHVATARA
jgi:dihydrolipoamide dehydrogenase